MATVKLGDIAIETKSSNKGDKTGIRIVGLGASYSIKRYVIIME